MTTPPPAAPAPQPQLGLNYFVSFVYSDDNERQRFDNISLVSKFEIKSFPQIAELQTYIQKEREVSKVKIVAYQLLAPVIAEFEPL